MALTTTPPELRTQQDDSLVHIESALVKEVHTGNGSTGYLIISNGVDEDFINFIRLNVGWGTIITNSYGEDLSMYDIAPGMRIDAEISPAMTKSIPPQAQAYQILIRQQLPSLDITTDRVVTTDQDNGFLYTGNPYDMSDQMKFIISNSTEILDRNNNRIPLNKIQPGQMVRVEHANFQTMSIPPQTPAYRIQVVY